jgi:hypothetical protein
MKPVELRVAGSCADRAARGTTGRGLALLAAVLITTLLTACQPPVRLMPTPVSFRTGEIDPFKTAGPKSHSTDVPVLYATNRGAIVETPEPIHTILPSERLRMRVAHVRIGDDTLDWETLHRLSTSDDPDGRPIIRLDWLEPLVSLGPTDTVANSPDAQAFFALVHKALALLGTSARPGETRQQLRERLRLKHIYFAAADIDTRQFINELGKYVDIVKGVSNAANLNDSALRVAAIVHRGSRIGRPDPTELDPEQSGFLLEASRSLGFDLIKVDPNAIPKLPPSSHAFWYEDPWVSSDLRGLLLLNAEPQRRGLTAHDASQGTLYWAFPPDFDDRVMKLFSPPLVLAPAEAPSGSGAPATASDQGRRAVPDSRM